MKFVHMADLHLDSKFESLSEIDGLSQKRRLEQRQALEKIIEYIKQNNIDFLFIAGDLYEHKYIRRSSIEYLDRLFKQIPEVQILITPGNHDPYIKNSFYATYKWPDNVHIFNDNIEKIDYEGLHIYGYGFVDFYCKDSKIEQMQITDKNDVNILITHGSLDGARDDNMEYNPLRSIMLRNLGFDYIALGHIHKPYYEEMSDQRVFYPGSTLSLGFDELGQHGILVGEITKNRKDIKFLPIDEREYKEEEIDITEIISNEELIEKINSLELIENDLYKITLIGKRFFELNTNEIKKQIERRNIVKIKNKTQIGIDIEQLLTQNSVKSIFIKRIIERKNRGELTEEEAQAAIEIGLDALN